MAFTQGTPGVGYLSIVQVGVSNATPIPILEVESADYSIKQETVPVENNEGEEIDSFVSKETISGKIVLNAASAALISAAVRGVTVTAASKVGFQHQAVVPTTPFTVTPTLPGSGTFSDDLGVINLTDGKKMTAGATSTGTNVYAVNTSTGVYTFNTADAGDSVLILGRATLAATGTTAEIASPAAGTAGSRWGIHLYKHTISGKEWGLYVPYAQIEGLDEAFKKSGWGQTTLSWKALPSATNKKFYRYGQN